MRTNTIIYTLALFLLMPVLSCQHFPSDNITPIDSGTLVDQAQTYFNVQINILDKGTRLMGDKNKSFIPSNWQPQWKQATTFHYQGSQVIEVPMLYAGNDLRYILTIPNFGNKGAVKKGNGVTKALFFKHKDGSMKGYVMRLILDESYYQQKVNNYKALSLLILKQDYSGFVLLSDWNGHVLDTYHLENGKVRFTSKRRAEKNSQTARLASCQEVYNCYTISGYNFIGSCTPDKYENCGLNNWCGECEFPPYYWNYNMCMTEVVCYSDPVDEPGSGGGSGGGGDGPTVGLHHKSEECVISKGYVGRKSW